MRVCVSVKGRFHAFQMAHQLEKAGCLERLMTTYPKYFAEKYGIPREKITSFLANEILERAWQKLPKSLRKSDLAYFWHEWHDKRASHVLPKEFDILVAWSSYALKTFATLKDRSVVKVLERGSSHIVYQQEILKEEYELWGLKAPKTHDPKIVEKELEEYELTDYIAVPSDFVVNSMIQKGISKEKLLKIPYGVDLTHFKPAKKNDTVFRVIFAGHFSVQKGAKYLLDAWKALNLQDAELWLIGSVEPIVQDYIAKKAIPNVVFKGNKSEFELSKFYAQGSLFCQPSVAEGLSLVIPQAMASGLPVLCTEHTGGGELVENGRQGFVIPIREVDAIKEKLLFFYENEEERLKMIDAAINRSREFSWDVYGKKLVSAYRGILTGDKNG